METYQAVTHHSSRPRTEPRNITGVFLTTRGASQDSAFRPRYKVPPLARSRASPSQSKTPMEHKRYAKIETLRSRDEPRGFNPQKVLKHKKTMPRADPDRELTKSLSPNQELFRQTPRKFTPTTNTGMLHLEYLNVDHKNNQNNLINNGYDMPQNETVVGEVQRLALSEFLGVEDCYKRICASNPSTLQTLLPSRKGKPNTPMTVRSLTTQATPHTLIHYTELDQTVGGSPRDKRPVTRSVVPAPFYLESSRLPRAKTDLAGSRKKIIKLSGTTQPETNKILAAPGVGVISRSNTQAMLRHQKKITGLEGHPAPTKSSATNSDPPANSKKEDPRAPTASPVSEVERLEINGHAMAQPNSPLLFIPVGSLKISDKEIRHSPRQGEVKIPISQNGSSQEVKNPDRIVDVDGKVPDTEKGVTENSEIEENPAKVTVSGHAQKEPTDSSEVVLDNIDGGKITDEDIIAGVAQENQGEGVDDDQTAVDLSSATDTEQLTPGTVQDGDPEHTHGTIQNDNPKHTSMIQDGDPKDMPGTIQDGDQPEGKVADLSPKSGSHQDEQNSLSIVISYEGEDGQRKTPVEEEETAKENPRKEEEF